MSSAPALFLYIPPRPLTSSPSDGHTHVSKPPARWTSKDLRFGPPFSTRNSCLVYRTFPGRRSQRHLCQRSKARSKKNAPVDGYASSCVTILALMGNRFADLRAPRPSGCSVGWRYFHSRKRISQVWKGGRMKFGALTVPSTGASVHAHTLLRG